jgi:hypothetical protein
VLSELSEQQCQRAFNRYQRFRPHLEQDVPLARVAAEASRDGRKRAISVEKLEWAIIGKGLTVREAAVRIKAGKTALYEALFPGSTRAN